MIGPTASSGIGERITPVYDDRNQPHLQGVPGLHVLLVGVSEYPHLPGGGGQPATFPFGLGQLSASALSAYRIYEWLQERNTANELPVPLATVRMLLSPTAMECKTLPALHDYLPGGTGHRGTLANLQDALEEWRQDAKDNRNHRTFLYFVGHGLQSADGEDLFLPEDFGERGAPLSRAVRVLDIHDGMARTNKAFPEIARDQFYFFDMCRTRVPKQEQQDFRQWKPCDLWTIAQPNTSSGVSDIDDRRAPAIFATLPHAAAYSLQGKGTFFCDALLECLKNDAVDTVNYHGQDQWGVSVGSLIEALSARALAQWN